MEKKKSIPIFTSIPDLLSNNLQIIACAGAGKTDFISERVAHLIAKGVAKPENIVAFTFTDRAAEELKFRIRNKIREAIGHQPDVGDLYVGTIHSFSYQLLKEFVPNYRVFDVLDEGKRFAFINSIREELYFDDLKDWLTQNSSKPYGITETSWIINTFIRCVDIVREEMLDVEQISASKTFPLAYRAYEEKLLEHRFLDYSNMLYNCVKTLSNDKKILNEINKKYTHITVDEYQDINKIQEELIRLLTGNKNNLCVVGDDDQSIYQWRGSTVENIITFKKRYKNVFTYELPVNYRSTDGIINTANKLISNNKPRLPKSMKDSGKKSEKGDFYKLKFEYQLDEIKFLIQKIKELIGTEWIEKDGSKRGLAYSDIAVFFRSVKYDGKPYIDALKKAGIPVAVSGIGGLFETDEIDLIYSILAYIGDFEKNRNHNNFEIPEIETIYESAKNIFPVPTKKQFVKQFEELKADIKEKHRISLQGLYSDILLLLGVSSQTFHNDDNEVVMYNLGRFSVAISDYEATRQYCTYRDIKRFCWFIKHYAESAYDAGEGEDPTLQINAVQVMTLHGTKGLGFPVVFMPFSVDRTPRQTDPGFLNPKKFDFKRYHGSEQDERRLFYVGMTRSKKFLFISTSHNPGFRKKKKHPSKFFNEVDEKYCTTQNINDPTKRSKLTPKPFNEDYRFPTSYSELSDYIHCEYDYKLRYIYGFNPVLVQALGYGKQVHNILNHLHKAAQDNGEVPQPELAADLIKKHFYLRYAADEQEERFKKSALQSVLNYLNLWKQDFILSLKSERNFEMDVDRALISGTIDLLKRQNISDEILEIIDFKTGNDRKVDEELHLQVQLYTIAAREALNLNVKKAYVHFLDEKKQSRLEILTTPNQLNTAMATIKDSIDGILNRRYRRNPKSKRHCNDCDWKKICPQKN